MRRALIPAFLLLLGSVVLGSTVFRDEIASAARLAQDVTINNTAANPVPVREQNLDGGNIRVHEQGTVNSADVDQRTAVRFGPTNYFAGQPPRVLIPLAEIPTGKKFIVTYLNVWGTSNNSQNPLVDGFCLTRLITPTSNDNLFGAVPLQRNLDILTGSEPAFLPLKSGEGLTFFCEGKTANGPSSSASYVMTVGGYFAPAS